MKKKRVNCPYCDELILPNAKKCRFCETDLKKNNGKTKKKFLGKFILFGLSGLGLIFIIFVIALIYIIVFVDNKFTGKELLDAVNAHRNYSGVQELQEDQRLCNNLNTIWLEIKEQTYDEDSFRRWAEREGIFIDNELAIPYDNAVSPHELHGQGTQTYWLIDSWVDSEQKPYLESEDYNVGCAYADEGLGIVIMAKKLNE